MKAWGSTRTGKDPGRAINLNLLPWLSFCDHVFSSMAGSAILINLTLQFQGLLLICTNFKKSRSMWSDVIIYYPVDPLPWGFGLNPLNFRATKPA